MKISSIKLKDYFELKKPKYTYIRIIPDKSIRNYNSSNIAKAISHTWKNLNRRITKEQKKLFFETNFKISYIIDIQNNNVNFYFLVPIPFLTILLEKIREIWSKATIEEVKAIEPFSDKSITYQVAYKKEDALSLQVDKKSNEPLNSLLSVIEIMKDFDRVTVIYNFLPRTQFGWLKQYQDTMDKLKKHKPIEREKSNVIYITKSVMSFIVDFMDSLMEVFTDLTGGKKSKSNTTTLAESLAIALESNKELTNVTKKKKELRVLDTQIAVVSNSSDETRKENNALAVCQAYRVLDEDNELIYKKVKEIPCIEDYRFKNIDINTVSTDECQNFIQIPARNLLRQFGIQHIEVNENLVPMKLRSGYLSLGSSKYKGESIEAFVEDSYDKASLPLVEIGAQGAGKSTFMANYYRFANTRKEGGVIIDFIKSCALADEVISYLPSKDVIVLDYTKPEDIQGFAFNEFKLDKQMSIFEKLSFANLQAQQVLTFVDSINIDQPLQARMRKYLSAAANVVFATGETSLKEVVRCLEDFDARDNYIRKLKIEERDLLYDEIKDLHELDEYSKIKKAEDFPTVIGTKTDRIDGILDRISLLREDFKLKHMFAKGGKGNIDFAQELEDGKVIVIKMPQDAFKKHSKNVIVTFLLSKIWIATEIRGRLNDKPKKTHIAIDEIFQTKTAMNMLANNEILPQTRKFGCKFVLSCQYTSQIEILMDTLIGAGASFMLMGGTNEKDFKRFEANLDNFEYEDLKEMKQYSSLNLIYYSGGYASFITALPKPISKK